MNSWHNMYINEKHRYADYSIIASDGFCVLARGKHLAYNDSYPNFYILNDYYTHEYLLLKKNKNDKKFEILGEIHICASGNYIGYNPEDLLVYLKKKSLEDILIDIGLDKL